jgi:negative regulator of sigma E activity
VSHAVAVGVQEHRNRRAARDRPGENELGQRQLVSVRDRASSTAAHTPSGSGPVCFRQSSKRSSASVVRASASSRRPEYSSFTDQS